MQDKLFYAAVSRITSPQFLHIFLGHALVCFCLTICFPVGFVSLFLVDELQLTNHALNILSINGFFLLMFKG